MDKEQLLKELSEAKQTVEATQAKLASIEQQIKEVNKPSAEQFIINVIKGCVIHKDNRYPDSVFYMKEGKVWFEIRKPHLWVNYDDVWKVLEDQYGLSYDDIQSLIKNVVEKHFKWEGLTPANKIWPYWLFGGETFQMGGINTKKVH